MTTNTASLHDALQAVICARISGATGLHSLRQLSAGASMETWSFDAIVAGGTLPLILRRQPARNSHCIDFARLGTEAAVIRAAVAAGVAAPSVRYVLQPDDGLGGGYLMERIEGETIGRKILRDATYETIRERLLQQIGAAAAKIHAVPLTALPALSTQTIEQALDEWQQEYRKQSRCRPVFELALRYLHDHRPETRFTPRLVHGDYRLGNLIVGPEGLRAVLDWELCHVGDPMQDLAWLCLPPWRFGKIDSPAAGLGSREHLYAAYEAAAGERVDRHRIHYWEIFGSLKWGLMCSGMVEWFRSGRDRSAERALIARRASESELDLLGALQE